MSQASPVPGDLRGDASERTRLLARRFTAALRARTSEAALSAYSAAWVDSPLSTLRHLVAHPLDSAAAALAIARLPHLTAQLRDTPEGRAVHRALRRPALFGTPHGVTGIAVLDVPADAAEYLRGGSRSTLRRKGRAAAQRGVTWRQVTDPGERRELLRTACEAERTHADAQYRSAAPQLDDLPDHRLWLAAFSACGEPLLLAVAPYDGEWAALRYFRTLGSSRESSDARYLMTAALVEVLSGLGVRHVFDTAHPLWLPNGLRHFQRMVGFRTVRVSARLR